MSDTDVWKKLREPFPSKVVGKLPKGGTDLDYVGHAAVTDRLLSVDPSWNWEPLALDERGLPVYDNSGGFWIKLTVNGVTRLGYGDGKDPKIRIGDAIRNAAMRFGVALDLWTKDELESQVKPAQPVTAGITQPQMNKMMALFSEGGVDDREARLSVVTDIIGRTVESSKELTKDEATKVIDRMEKDIAEARETVPEATGEVDEALETDQNDIDETKLLEDLESLSIGNYGLRQLCMEYSGRKKLTFSQLSDAEKQKLSEWVDLAMSGLVSIPEQYKAKDK